MANYLKGIGDPQTRVNEIIPKFDAQIFNFLAQCVPGICWSETNRFALTTITRGVRIGAGMCQAHGYFGMSDALTQLDFITPTSGNQFVRVFAEINLSVTPHRFSVRATAQSTSSNIALTQNNLSTTPNGVYQIPLYLLTLATNGTITSTDQRPQMTKPEHAKNAEQATNATNATNLTGTGTIATGVTAVTQTQATNNTRVATTAYVRTAIAALETFSHVSSGSSASARNSAGGDGEWGRYTMPNGVIWIWYTSSDQHVTFPWAFPNKCWMVGYAGHRGAGTADNVTSRNVGITWTTVTRTGFSWSFQSGASSMNNRKYWAIGC